MAASAFTFDIYNQYALICYQIYQLENVISLNESASNMYIVWNLEK